ncbi:INO80 complex subunit C isoform X1 [Hetaerina americana]|uniref:INO80 complex subunit C isoform X1 n=1 Tax=Hetaerina americana TaxID=62018 RepID=UPI003A7F2C2D
MPKRRPGASQSGEPDSGLSSVGGSGVPSPVSIVAPENSTEEVKEEPKYSFKNVAFQHSKKTNNKKRAWRSLKQIITLERALPWGKDAVHFSTIDALPSYKPPKKYSDISGLPAKYTDPQTKLFYANSEEFKTIRTLPSDIVAGYLALRRASNPVG